MENPKCYFWQTWVGWTCSRTSSVMSNKCGVSECVSRGRGRYMARSEAARCDGGGQSAIQPVEFVITKIPGSCLTFVHMRESNQFIGSGVLGWDARGWWGLPDCPLEASCCLERSWPVCQRAASSERTSGQRRRNLQEGDQSNISKR